ncbi:ATP-binding protein [Marivita sp. S6314]|uniref:ATP-binding protein n=1 Tax=Marivita sp. S6314 TaxID=2926406 RepID=UPI001FF64A72|nr:ATP-binding protein [Marivita sp. S6314]MCK0149483.1 ATP-binding protein [Marivita sp. S6314]
MAKSSGYKRKRRWVAGLIGFGLFATFVVTLFLGREVMLDLEQQRSASSDNVQWTLTQVEVEYLSFLNAAEHIAHAGIDPETRADDLNALRLQFDVFYSRIDTLRQSQLFANLRQDLAFAEPLGWVTGYLDQTIPLIDGPDAVLAAEAETLWQQADALNEDVRALSVSGLSYFARLSDARRLETSDTLARLAILTFALFLALAALSVYLLYINRIIQKRSSQLRQSNHRINTILSASLDAVIVVNSKGHVIEFNAAAVSIFGYDVEEVRGKPIGDLIVPDHLRDAHNTGMERMQRGGDRHVVGKGRVQLEAMRANGDIFPVELVLQSAFDGDAEIVIGFIRDTSHRVKAEQELISARDRALAGEKAKADFLTVMSHEIRTPLNGLLGNLSLLKNSRLTKEQSRFVHNMGISGNVLLKHVDSVLDIARFEAGKLSIVAQPFDLNTVLQDLVDGQSGHAASRGTVIEWQWLGPVKPWVSADKQRLEQILLNLVGNAIKFTENGRVTLEVEVSEKVAAHTFMYEFRIIDTGVGIAEADIERVFDDFHTHDASIGRKTEGTGLGLGIARRFADAMGGELGVESELGEGSVFWVRLPFKQVAALEDHDAGQDVSTDQAALDLLVVEDNEINLEVICNMLELDGHSVTTAQNGKAGVDAAQARRFDAILMDISMPVMDGPTATRNIRAGDGPSRDVPILAVSANVLPDAVDGFRAAGMDAFVGKPISIDALRQALAEVTHRSGPRTGTTMPVSERAVMRQNLGDAAYDRLQSRFLKEAEALVHGLDARLQDADLGSLAAEAHKVAGSAAVFDALAFRDALIAVETTAKTGDRDALRDVVHRLQAVWDSTKSTIDS